VGIVLLQSKVAFERADRKIGKIRKVDDGSESPPGSSARP
jgi:hypothetical protein